MPHFTLHISPNGPVLNAFVGVSQPRTLALQAAGQPIPKMVPVTGLVDTGARLLAFQGFHALLGRDILNRCLFSYNGDFGVFTLAY